MIHLRFGSGTDQIDVHLSPEEARRLYAHLGQLIVSDRPKMEPRMDAGLAAKGVENGRQLEKVLSPEPASGIEPSTTA